jgi:hypothetical protein
MLAIAWGDRGYDVDNLKIGNAYKASTPFWRKL